ncbi:hypothetical protein QTP70_027518 [Hemibagrus guttatus]|uniref:Protein phosphatase 1 regulatory subunit 14C n=1 Tax=Hemibagrus guttatus TaxID=175788 RepID=A0AAE0UVN6_9TELE|nr:hypothetical protein QTP70_027518 [Hemibagrus guttatus]
MSAASPEPSAPIPTSPGRVFFQTAPSVGCVGNGPVPRDDPAQKKQGKVTVKYDRKELRKRLVLEEWIIEQLSELYDCEGGGLGVALYPVAGVWALAGNRTRAFHILEEEMPEVEIDIDDLLEVNSEDERAVKLQVSASIHTRDCWLCL